MALSRRQQSLKAWGKQKWRTSLAKNQVLLEKDTCQRQAIKNLSPAEYAATTRAKRKSKT